jgi:nicotinamide-nucleotide amidase
MKLVALAETVGRLLVAQHRTLSLCESCTAGMLSSVVTQVPGSSRYFLGGIVAYDNSVKQNIVGVEHATIETHGAVSQEVAEEMAEGTRVRVNSDICVSITGIAGPEGGSEEKPVGLIFVAVAQQGAICTSQYRFSGPRDAVRRKACQAALELLIQVLKGDQ